MLGIIVFIGLILGLFVWPEILAIALLAFIGYNVLRFLADCLSAKKLMLGALLFNGIPACIGIALLLWAM